jgi:hypothetical protein
LRASSRSATQPLAIGLVCRFLLAPGGWPFNQRLFQPSRLGDVPNEMSADAIASGAPGWALACNSNV